LALRGGLVRMIRGQHEPQVAVLVRGLALARRDVDDDRVPQVRVRPRGQVLQPGLLRGLPERDGQRVGLARVAAPADLEPGELAGWWPLISPPGEYAAEAEYLAALLSSAAGAGRRAEVLDLGSGGGCVALHLSRAGLALTLVDRSAPMLAASRGLNPGLPHLQ